MRRLFVFWLAVAIALSSCQSSLKPQIQGKWRQADWEKHILFTEIEITDEDFVSNLRDKSGASNSKSKVKYKLIGNDQIVFTYDNKQKTSNIKVEEDILLIKSKDDEWNRYKKSND